MHRLQCYRPTIEVTTALQKFDYYYYYYYCYMIGTGTGGNINADGNYAGVDFFSSAVDAVFVFHLLNCWKNTDAIV